MVGTYWATFGTGGTQGGMEMRLCARALCAVFVVPALRLGLTPGNTVRIVWPIFTR